MKQKETVSYYRTFRLIGSIRRMQENDGTRIAKMVTDEEFSKAYDIDSRVYHGGKVTKAQKAFVLDICNRILNNGLCELPPEWRLWAIFAIKDYE